MKTKADPRHQKRINLMQNLFSYDFQKSHDVIPADLSLIVENLKEIDEEIKQAAPDRPLTQINKIDLSILRLSVFELIISSKIPPKVIVDEAIELGKEYGSDSSPSFINGVLGQIIKRKGITV